MQNLLIYQFIVLYPTAAIAVELVKQNSLLRMVPSRHTTFIRAQIDATGGSWWFMVVPLKLHVKLRVSTIELIVCNPLSFGGIALQQMHKVDEIVEVELIVLIAVGLLHELHQASSRHLW